MRGARCKKFEWNRDRIIEGESNIKEGNILQRNEGREGEKGVKGISFNIGMRESERRERREKKRRL